MSNPSSQSNSASNSSDYQSDAASAQSSSVDPRSDLRETLYFGHGCDESDADLLANYAITPFDDDDIHSQETTQPKTFGSVDEYLRLRKIWLAADYQPKIGQKAKHSIPIADNMRKCVLWNQAGELHGEPLNKAQYRVYEQYFKPNAGTDSFDVRWNGSLKFETWNRAIQLKFRSDGPEAQQARDFLLSTGDKVLMYKHIQDEESEYWRKQLGDGEDLLGDMLMQMREQLRAEGVQIGGQAQSLKNSGFTLNVSAI